MNDSPHSADALKPCPFCGCDDIRVHLDWSMMCANCGAEGALMNTQDAAIAAWNRRPTPASPDLGELRAKAEAAGSEAWNDEADADGYVFGSDGDSVCICHANMGHMPEPIYPEHRAAFIAAANPATILALLDRLDRAEARVIELDKASDIAIELMNEANSDAERAEAAAGAVPEGFKLVPITEMQGDTARQWAWDQVRRDCDDSNWTVGESGTYYGFFLHGWHYRKQYESQLAAPPAQGLPAAPDVPMEIDPRSKRYSADFISGFNMCRREVLSLAKVARPPAAAPSEPVAWIRFRSDGGYEGPIMDCVMEEVRKKSGAWTPLVVATPPAQGAGTGDATIVAIGYESGFMATDPDHDGATVKLHYRDEATAEAAFCAITRIIDRAIANSGRTE